jgi:peroxiredoxin Q/BCP
MLQLGDQAPDFTLPTDKGDTFHLAAQHGKPVVLYFYPKDDTPGCTAEACAFRDQYADFLDLGAIVVGVSSDSEASHQKFSQKHRLPFPLLADTGGQLRKAYEVTFVIDAAGKIAYIFNSLSGATDHVSKTKQVLRELVG